MVEDHHQQPRCHGALSVADHQDTDSATVLPSPTYNTIQLPVFLSDEDEEDEQYPHHKISASAPPPPRGSLSSEQSNCSDSDDDLTEDMCRPLRNTRPRCMPAHPEDVKELEKKRAGNRMAARKCRQMKKTRQEDLKKKMLDYECANTKLKYDVTQLRLQVKSLEEKLSSHHCQYHPAAPKNSPEVTQLFTDVTQLGTSDVTQMASSHVTLSTGQHVLPPAGMMVNSMSLLLPDQNYS